MSLNIFLFHFYFSSFFWDFNSAWGWLIVFQSSLRPFQSFFLSDPGSPGTFLRDLHLKIASQGNKRGEAFVPILQTLHTGIQNNSYWSLTCTVALGNASENLHWIGLQSSGWNKKWGWGASGVIESTMAASYYLFSCLLFFCFHFILHISLTFTINLLLNRHI